MNEHESQPDWEDRLVDHALREALGGEAPPDLAEKILAASSDLPVASPLQGDQAMNELQHVAISKRKHWTLFVVAASLLMAVGIVGISGQWRHARVALTDETAQNAKSPELPDKESAQFGTDDDLVNLESDSKLSAIPAKKSSITDTDSEVSQDLGNRRKKFAKTDKGPNADEKDLLKSDESLTNLDSSLPSDKPKSSSSAEGEVPTLSTVPYIDRLFSNSGKPAPEESLQMMVVPGIIIAEDEEERLGIEAEGQSAHTAKPASGGRFRVDAQPGKDVYRFLAEQAPTDVDAPSTLPREASAETSITKREDSRLLIGPSTMGRAKVTQRGEVNLELGDKIAEYQQLARLERGQHLDEISGRVSTLSAEISDLRRQKRILDVQQGIGPDYSGDKYTRIYENLFVKTKKHEENFSTFSIDVDTASYANTRQFLMRSGQLPPPDAVRLEELINYFDYDYSGPTGDVPFASHVEVAGCPWDAEHRLVRIGIKGREIDRSERPQSNLVFLVDVSGSMNDQAKLPLLVEGMKLLTRELGENDKVAIVVYASSEGLAMPSTRGDKQQVILGALNKLRAGGSTAGGAGIELAYKTALTNFIEGGVNRVILCTDGDFNVGVTSTGELERMAEENAKQSGVFLTVLGFGRGNLNDSMMEAVSGKGNGNYHYVDNLTEARKVLVEEMAGTLVTIAKDVKIQIDFNPHQVAGYRLLGYENRMLQTEDFNDDKKDAGEIGAGHTVTALYEIVPAGQSVDVPPVDTSKYVAPVEQPADAEVSAELLTLKIRYKEPDADTSTKLEFPVSDEGGSFAQATADFQFASSVASFGMLLRDSEHKGNASYATVAEIAQGASSRDEHGYRAEFLELVQRARQLSGE